MKNKITFFCAFLVFSSFSQMNNDGRIEFDLKTDERIGQVIPLGDRGFVTLGLENVKGGNDIFHISSYSTDLKRESTVDFERESRIANHSTLFSEDSSKLIFLFSNKKDWVLKIYSIESNTLEERVFEKADWTFRPMNYLFVNGKIVMNGFQKKKPTIQIMDLESGFQQFVLVPGVSSRRTVESIGLDNLNEKVVIFMRDGKDMKTASMQLLLLETNGEISTSMILDKDPNFSIIDGSVTWINESSFLIAGTYGTSGRRGYAAGYYLSRWTDQKQEFITYHSFTEFATYLSYLPQKAQKKMEKRVERKKDKGATDIIQSLVVIHPVIIVGDQYRIIGESFYPTYRTETYTTFVNGRATTSTRQVFDGYQYTHAAVLDLDESGQKIKDYCFSMYLSNKPFSVVKNLRITQNDNGDMRLMYSTGSRLKATTITTDQEMTETDYGQIITAHEGDNVRYTGFTNCSYWYENNYLVYGVQTIKNKEDEKVSKKRTIFFINKISYEK
ncbi:MAG: hypothetical protein ACO1N0_03285 [Fluviicola sp.]